MDQTKSPKRRTPTSSVAAKEAVAVVPPPPTPPDEANPWVNRRASAQATRAANARQASGRRRFVDPTTCEREYTVAEMEFMHAMHEYKQSSGRMFPTWSEVLEVLKALGYEKLAGADTASASVEVVGSKRG